MAKDFVLEIGTEEIPARFINPALKQLKELAAKSLQELRLNYQEINTYGTPRRLVLYVRQMDEKQAPLVKEVKGPAKKVAFDADGNPTKAVLGFARGQGVAVEDLVTRQIKNVDYMYAVIKEEGRPAEKVLAEAAPQLVSGLYFPKPMKWGNLDFRFARPIRWILALFGSDVVPFTVADQASNRFTYGHRFLSDGPIKVASAEDYFAVVEQGYVMVDVEKRRQVIWQQVQDLTATVGGKVEYDEKLLTEVTNLVEYPTALMGSFAEEYLELPAEVIVTPMREHQRYFPVLDDQGRLMPKFIAVRNGTDRHLDIVTSGNEKVLSARLADAKFFFEEDLKTPLADKVDGLKKVVWLESLGTVYEKAERVAKLAGYLAEELNAHAEQRGVINRAAKLAKADLVTNMVYEFPELQGIMGREYALRNGENPAVAQAIYEHYLPRFADDELPQTLPGRLLSIADKLDSIVGCFAIGIKPSGSQDPYALRRQALGISNIILNAELPVSLTQIITAAYNGYHGSVELKLSQSALIKELLEFFKQRIKGIFSERGLSYDTIDAVLAAGFDHIADAWYRGQALTEFRTHPEFDDLLTVFNRANNLAKNFAGGEIKEELLMEAAEKELYQKYNTFSAAADQYMQQKDYAAVLKEIVSLLGPINRFFEQVMVMVDDEQVRNNRLALLYKLAQKMKLVADFSKIVA